MSFSWMPVWILSHPGRGKSKKSHADYSPTPQKKHVAAETEHLI